MAAFENDSSFAYGSRVLTIDSVAYVAENCVVNRGSKTIEQTNEIDEPTRQVSYRTFVVGSATLQLASTATVIPEQGDEFSTTWVTAIGSETFYLTDIDQPESKGDAKFVNVSWRKKLN
jgi:hypothetical protein